MAVAVTGALVPALDDPLHELRVSAGWPSRAGERAQTELVEALEHGDGLASQRRAG